jgi:hypothetical protein
MKSEVASTRLLKRHLDRDEIIAAVDEALVDEVMVA